MSDALIDKMRNMERQAILEADNKLAQRTFDLTKAGIAREDLNLKFEETKGFEAPQMLEFNKLFNNVYEQLSEDAQEQEADREETNEEIRFSTSFKLYNNLVNYINGILKYNKQTQQNKRTIDDKMITLVPLIDIYINTIFIRSDIGTMTDFNYERLNKALENMRIDIESRNYKQIFVPPFRSSDILSNQYKKKKKGNDGKNDGDEGDEGDDGDDGDVGMAPWEMANLDEQYNQLMANEEQPQQYEPYEEPQQIVEIPRQPVRNRNMEDMGDNWREEKYREEPPKRRKGPISKRGDIPNSDFYDLMPNLDNFDEYVLGNGKGRKATKKQKVNKVEKDVIKLLKKLNIKLK